MFNKERLADAIVQYKQVFATEWWAKENYKWKAVKCFQANWDVEAGEFADMLERSLSGTYNLLASMNNFPRRMIKQFAKFDPPAVRQMFRELYDESTDLYERIEKFKTAAEKLRQKYRSDAGQHYQHENAITTYLWLRYPDKYYIFKYSEAKNVALAIDGQYEFKKGGYAQNVRNGYALYDEVCAELKRDADLVDMFKQQLTDEYYPDPELKTLTMDVCYYISRNIQAAKREDGGTDWLPEAYEPGITAEVWAELLKDESVFTQDSLEIVNRIKDNGGQATCIELADKYGNTVEYYRNGSVALAKRIQKKTSCAVAKREDGSTRWWAVLYLGRKAEDEEAGSFVWKIRDELMQALMAGGSQPVEIHKDKYVKEDFLREVYLTEEQYEELVSVLEKKRNIILQGAPGVGKTYAAIRLAYSMMGEKAETRVKSVQFHQNYAYEDFIMGYKPDNNGFALKPGIFYSFCKEAEKHPDESYFFIIDEINRGNMSKIFGELLSRIETDYRGDTVALAYNDELFSVPKNLYIIGMMNTADRSLAMIDYALRRRFSFFEMQPAFASPGFIAYRDSLGMEQFNNLIETIEDLNVAIEEDKTLGKGFCIGHSYFCNLDKDTCTAARLREIVKYDILPMLKEYWFDDDDKYETWASALQSAIK